MVANIIKETITANSHNHKKKTKGVGCESTPLPYNNRTAEKYHFFKTLTALTASPSSL